MCFRAEIVTGDPMDRFMFPSMFAPARAHARKAEGRAARGAGLFFTSTLVTASNTMPFSLNMRLFDTFSD